jgi:phage-related protein (TIGR01555 family)
LARSKNRMAAALQTSQLRVVDEAALDLQSPAAAHLDSWDQPGGGWQNPVTGFGTSRDKTTYNRFAPTALMNVEELSAIYHGEDLAARIIDIVPDEMLREGFSVDVGDPKLNELVSEKLEALAIDDKLADGIRWGRLFGGGALLLGADDKRSAATPLAIDRVESLAYLYVFDRRYLMPLTWYRDPGNPKLGQPETYMVLSPSSFTDVPMSIVHESRMVLFGGASTGIRERQQNMGWDVSVLQRPAKVLGDFNIGWNAASVLLQDGNQAVFTMSGLAETLAAGGEAALLKRLKQVDFGRSVINATIVDAGTAADSGGDPPEKFERQQFPMTGIPDMLEKFMLRLAAAAQIPVTILMGQSPAGMNATGQSDFQWFYDRIRAQQNLKLAPKIRRIVKLLLSTKEFSGFKPDSIKTKFPPLWTEPPLTRAQTRKTLLEGDAIAVTTIGSLTPAEHALQRFQGADGFENELQLTDAGVKAREDELDVDLEQLAKGSYEEPPAPDDGSGFTQPAPNDGSVPNAPPNKAAPTPPTKKPLSAPKD